MPRYDQSTYALDCWWLGTHYLDLPVSFNIDPIGTKMSLRIWRQSHKSMKCTCQQCAVQACVAFMDIWNMWSWRNMLYLIHLKATLTNNVQISIMLDHIQSFVPNILFGGITQYKQENATPHFEVNFSQQTCDISPPKSQIETL